MTRWALIAGTKGSGKSRAARAVAEGLAARGIATAGFVQDAIEADGERVAYRLARLGRGDARVVARRAASPAAPTEEAFCSFVFDLEAFAEARRWLAEDAPGARVVILDEVSKLEAAGKGHHDAIAAALAGEAIVVLSVQAAQLFGVVERFGLDEPVASFDTTSDDIAAAFVDALVGAVADDLARAWRARVLATREPGGDGADRWARRAARFDRRSREPGAADPLVAALGPELRPDDVLVDVGAGAGRHVVPLAGRCRRVIAIEPSPSMRAHLARRVGDEGLGNVEIIADRFPCAGVEGDVVLASHVLYGIEDAPAFLRAMTVAARRACVLCLGVVAPADALAPLRARVHGAPAPRRPAAPDALALLRAIGLDAQITLLAGSTRRLAFGTSDDEIDELCLRVNVDPDEAGRARVRRALADLAPAGEDGAHDLGVTGPNALLTWRR